jgi:hypothetical protein
MKNPKSYILVLVLGEEYMWVADLTTLPVDFAMRASGLAVLDMKKRFAGD